MERDKCRVGTLILNLWHPRLNLILLLFQTYHLNTPIIMPHQDIMLSITLHYHKSTSSIIFLTNSTNINSTTILIQQDKTILH